MFGVALVFVLEAAAGGVVVVVVVVVVVGAASAAAAAAGQDIMINQSQIVYQTQNSTRMSCWYLVNGIFHPYINFLDTSHR